MVQKGYGKILNENKNLTFYQPIYKMSNIFNHKFIR